MLKLIVKVTWKSVSKKSKEQVIWFKGSIVSMLLKRNNKVLLRVPGTPDLIKEW